TFGGSTANKHGSSNKRGTRAAGKFECICCPLPKNQLAPLLGSAVAHFIGIFPRFKLDLGQDNWETFLSAEIAHARPRIDGSLRIEAPARRGRHGPRVPGPRVQ